MQRGEFTMAHDLSGKKIAALVTDGFEQVELTDPKAALEGAGANVDIVSPKEHEVKGWNRTDWGDTLEVNTNVADVTAGGYDGLLLPGGVISADHLRMDKPAVAFVRTFLVERKPVAAICHAPWILIEAGGVAGRRLTSYPSLKTDLENAGADWVDEEVVIDVNVVSSRTPDDLPAFDGAMIDLIDRASRGVQESREYRMTSAPGV
jgi:protease I